MLNINNNNIPATYQVKHVENSCQTMRLKIEAAGKPDTLMGSLTGGVPDLFR